MIAKIKLWGNEYLVSNVSWVNGKISHASFSDENDIHYVIFQKVFKHDLDAEENRDPNKNISANLDEILIWTKK